MSKKCPKCKHPMTLLLYSYVCDEYCEARRTTRIKSRGLLIPKGWDASVWVDPWEDETTNGD